MNVQPAAKRSVLWVVLGVVVVFAVGAGGWWMLGKPSPKLVIDATRPAASAASAPSASDATTASTQTASASAPIAAPASAPDQPASVALPMTPASPASTPVTRAALNTPADKPTTGAASPDAQREAADKRAKEKAAREKAEREAKAKAKVLAEQLEREAAQQAAQQQAERQRAEAQRLREQPPAPATAPIIAQPQAAPAPRTMGVKEQCASRSNFISRMLCESRACKTPQQENEPFCKQMKLDEEARQQKQR